MKKPFGTAAASGDSRGCAVAVLAGGQSRRMGVDKAALRVAPIDAPDADPALAHRETGDESLLERTVRAAALATDRRPVLVVGRARPDGWTVRETEFIVDDTPGLGPLGGLRSALLRCDRAGRSGVSAPSILAVACDMPLLTVRALRWLATAWTEQLSALEDADELCWPAGIAVRGRDGRLEPLFSVYRAAACLPEIDARMAAGHRSLTRWIEESGRFIVRTAPDEIAAALVNVNTPEDWQAVHAAAAGHSLPSRSERT